MFLTIFVLQKKLPNNVFYDFYDFTKQICSNNVLYDWTLVVYGLEVKGIESFIGGVLHG